ncbi:MAG: cell division protein ZapE [Methylococcaceae bacterium]|nr:cell division protein ZapE [Methylococcaceae bacterium]
MFNYLFQQAKQPQSFKHSTANDNVLEKRYQELVVKRHIESDSAQVEVLGHLQQLLSHISDQVSSPQNKPSILQKILYQSDLQNKSLYIFGDVGRGKSMLMEVFFEACPISQKRRVHFHNFMLEVHEFVHHWRKKHDTDPLAAFAKHLRTSTWLLCFDEFNVTDIADAMILTRLFDHLFAQGLVFVATSNYHPDNLYQGGLQRSLFLPFIKRLKQAAEILELVAKEDYRFAHFKALNRTFYIGAGIKASAFLSDSFADLTNDAATEPCTLQVQRREVYFKAAHGDILYSSFEELCNRALGSADYIEISEVFNTVFIADIPQLSIECRDQARRFVTLIDALYEGNVKLICTAAVPVGSLYIDDGVFEFKRTKSRLMEMQSTEYMQRRQSLSIDS